MNFGSVNETHQKKVILIRITCIAWLFAKGISWKAWVAERLFPVVPSFDFVPIVPDEIHFSLLAISLLGLALVFIFPNKKALVFIVFCAEISSCLLDNMRWQPWEYQYLLTFLFVLASKKEDSIRLLQLLSLLLAMTYLFSGLHKCSGGFLHLVWDKMVLRGFFGFPPTLRANPIIYYSGILIPIVECAAGISLLFNDNKKPAVYALVAMHLFLLILIGPFGLNYNFIVWPWNVAMVGLVYVLFFKNPSNLSVPFFKSTFHLAVIVLVGLLPILSFGKYWPDYLSFNLYSGSTKQLAICVENADRYPQLKTYFSSIDKFKLCQKSDLLYTNDWALQETQSAGLS